MTYNEQFNAMMRAIEEELAYIIYEKSTDQSKHVDNKCVKLNKVLKVNLTNYDEIAIPFGTPMLLDQSGYHYSLSNLPFDELCSMVDEIAAYYNKIDNFVVKESYTEEEINELTFEELQKMPLEPFREEQLHELYLDEENVSDEEYIEEYRKAIKAEYVKQ